MTELDTPQPTHEALARLRALAKFCTPAARQRLATVLEQPPGAPQPCPPLAVLTEQSGERTLTLGYSEWELARVLTAALAARPPTRPVLLIDLASGEERDARTMVYFAENEFVLPPAVGDVIELDLQDRRKDPDRNRDTERSLQTARDLIAAGEPVPAAHFNAIIDVLEIDLETRRKDTDRDLDGERTLAAAQRQLITREPWRELPCNAPATQNAGCDRCGTHDRRADSRYCRACLEDGYTVYVDGTLETGHPHDTPEDARDEAGLVCESAPDQTVEIRGPEGFSEIVQPGDATST